MKQFCIVTISLGVAATLLLPNTFCAQSSTDSSGSAPKTTPLPSDLSGDSYKRTPIPQVEIITPFSANSHSDKHPLEYRSQDQMTDTDHALVQSVNSSIHDGATFAGMEFDKGNWSYQQLVCQALPDHIFLIFKEDNGPGDVSIFSAAIPRSGEGRVRIVAVERRGYSLFSPAPVNALTISAFNRIRADEPENKSADWLATALCYAALAGAHPAISPLPKDSDGADFTLAFPPKLEVGSDGESTVRFVDVATGVHDTEWALTFNPKGLLLSVDHFATPAFSVTPIPSK
jgi:hypothetical protein